MEKESKVQAVYSSQEIAESILNLLEQLGLIEDTAIASLCRKCAAKAKKPKSQKNFLTPTA